MELFIQIIFIAAIVKYSLKASQTSSLWMLLSYGLLAGGVAFALYPLVLEQPGNIISELLRNRAVVTDAAVIVTAEAILGISISVMLIEKNFKPREQQGKAVRILKVIPGVIVFFAIGYFELMFFTIRVGSEFLTTATLYSAGITIAIIAQSLLFKYSMPSSEMKLELKMILNAMIFIIALLINSMVAEYNISNNQSAVEWEAPAVLVALFALLFTTGYMFPKIKLNSKK